MRDNRAEMKAEAGRIVRLDGRQLAVYRDPSGELSTCSATCPHMRCIVHWNAAEQNDRLTALKDGVEIAYAVEENEYQGTKYVELRLEDFR